MVKDSNHESLITEASASVRLEEKESVAWAYLRLLCLAIDRLDSFRDSARGTGLGFKYCSMRENDLFLGTNPKHGIGLECT